MPYKIQHKSYNSCLIKFDKNKRPRPKKRFNLSIVVFAAIALIIGIDIGIVMVAVIFFWIITRKAQLPRSDFEIEFNRPKNLVTVRDSNTAQPSEVTYPLNSLKGFGFLQIPNQSKTRQTSPQYGALAKLFFEFDNRIFNSGSDTNASITRNAKKIYEVDGDFYWLIPLQLGDHIIPVAKAVEIKDSMDEWLRRTNRDNALDEIHQDEPEQEVEILRDFRDIAPLT